MLVVAQKAVFDKAKAILPSVATGYITTESVLKKIRELRTVKSVKGTLVICHVSLVVSEMELRKKFSDAPLGTMGIRSK